MKLALHGWMDALVNMNPTELFQQKPVIPKPSLDTGSFIHFLRSKGTHPFCMLRNLRLQLLVATQASSQNAMHPHRPNNCQIEESRVPSQILMGTSGGIRLLIEFRNITNICAAFGSISSCSPLLPRVKGKQTGALFHTLSNTRDESLSSFFAPQSTY